MGVIGANWGRLRGIMTQIADCMKLLFHNHMYCTHTSSRNEHVLKLNGHSVNIV